MKRINKRRVWLAAFFALLLVCVFPQLVFAGGIKGVNLGTLKSKKPGSYSNTRYNFANLDYVYHKFKVTKPGFIVVTGKAVTSYGSYTGINVTLCNGKKKPVDYSSANYVNSDEEDFQFYALKKGTYYIRLNVNGSTKGYVLAYRYLGATDKGAASKAKAAAMKATNGMQM